MNSLPLAIAARARDESVVVLIAIVKFLYVRQHEEFAWMRRAIKTLWLTLRKFTFSCCRDATAIS
jgi:hypothetical protein